METTKKERMVRILLMICSAAALLTGEFIYFYGTLAKNELLGLGSDSLLINMILEHWYDCFSAHSPILTLRAFWPCQNTLCYTDAWLGPGIIYSMFRAFGCDIFSAHNLSLAALHFTGVIFMYAALRKLKVSRLFSFAGILLSFWSCSFTQLSYHTQFFSLSYVSIFFFAALHFICARGKGFKARLFWGSLATTAVGLTWLSSFYTAYFISLLIMLSAVLMFIYRAAVKNLRKDIRFIKKHIKETAFYILLQLTWLIPLFIIYLPFYLHQGGYEEAFTLAHSPLLTDILRTGSYAPLETWLRYHLPVSVISGYESLLANSLMENSYGWPVIAFLMFICCIPLCLTQIKKKNKALSFLILSFIISMSVIYLSVCRFGNTTAWIALHGLIPGSSAIRAPGRVMGIFAVPMSFIICYCLSDIKAPISSFRSYLPILLDICLLFILTATAQADHYTNINTSAISDWLDSVSDPPKDCTSMVIIPSATAEHDGFQINMNGWLVADRFKLNTVNGYSGNYPDEWDLIRSDISVYLKCVQEWLEYNDLLDDPGIYYYITDDDHWVRYSDVVLVSD